MKSEPSPTEEYTKLEEKKFVKLLQWMSTMLSLSIPNLYNYNGLAVLFLLYSLLICILLLVLCIYTIYFKITHSYIKTIVTAAILDGVTILGVTVTNILSVLFAVVFHRRDMVQIVKNLKEVEKKFNEKFNAICQLEEEGLFLQLFCLEFFVFSYIIFDSVYNIIEYGLLFYTLCLVMHLNVFMMSINVMQIQLISTCIKQYFKKINERLFLTMHYPFAVKVNGTANNLVFGNIEIKFFLKMYDKLCDIVDLVSNSYGIQIVFMCFIIIVRLIESLNLLMKYALKIDIIGAHFKIPLLIPDTWNSVIYIIFGVILAVSCERTSDEINNTSIIAYKILLNFPSCPRSHQQETTKNGLMLLAEHLSQRKVKFSAARFFTVDHTMLYMIFGSIAAYLVVILQFN